MGIGVSAENTKYIGDGKCRDNLTWTLTEDGMLTISGSGKMYDYNNYPSETKAPWLSYGLSKIKYLTNNL